MRLVEWLRRRGQRSDEVDLDDEPDAEQTADSELPPEDDELVDEDDPTVYPMW